LPKYKTIINHYIQNKPKERIFYKWIIVDNTNIMLNMPIKDILEFRFLTKYFEFFIVLNYNTKRITLTHRMKEKKPRILNIEEKDNEKIKINNNHVEFILNNNLNIFDVTDNDFNLFKINFCH
jgi:hypothetical protein